MTETERLRLILEGITLIPCDEVREGGGEPCASCIARHALQEKPDDPARRVCATCDGKGFRYAPNRGMQVPCPACEGELWTVWRNKDGVIEAGTGRESVGNSGRELVDVVPASQVEVAMRQFRFEYDRAETLRSKLDAAIAKEERTEEARRAYEKERDWLEGKLTKVEAERDAAIAERDDYKLAAAAEAHLVDEAQEGIRAAEERFARSYADVQNQLAQVERERDTMTRANETQLRDRETATRELLNALAGYRTWDGPNKRQLRRLDAACDHLLDLLGDE